MAEDNKPNSGTGVNGNSTAGQQDETAMMRLPSAFVMLSQDNNENGKHFAGTVGLKYGTEKKDWLRMSYSEMKKLMDFCNENKTLFNKQLAQERKDMVVSDL